MDLIEGPGLTHGFFTMGRASRAAQSAIEEVLARFRALLLRARIPERAKKELEAYLDRGLLCRGFARPTRPDVGAHGGHTA